MWVRGVVGRPRQRISLKSAGEKRVKEVPRRERERVELR